MKTIITLTRTKAILLFVFFVSIRFSAISQNVGISTSGITPNASAMLDIDNSPNNNKGLLIPRVTFAERTGVNFNPKPAVAKGLLIYQTDNFGEGEGFYYDTSTTTTAKWVKLFSATTGWSLTGNAAIDSATNFIGTTDAMPFRIMTNNTQRMIVSSNGNVGIGTTAPDSRLVVGSGATASNNIGFGTSAYANVGNRYSSGYLVLGDNVKPAADPTDGMVNVNTHASYAGSAIVVKGNTGIEFHTKSGAATAGAAYSSVRAVIDESGNVGIGTTVPAAKLEVDGTSGITIKIVDGNQGAGKVLASDATGQGSWSTLSSIGGGNCFTNWQLYISGPATSGMLGTGTPGSFTVPAGVTLIKVQVWGGGGGGSGGWGGAPIYGGGGGGGGGYAEGIYIVVPSTTYAVTIGDGGVGGTSANGTNGGTSSFGVLISATGGDGGYWGSSGIGGESGTGSGGYLNTTLGNGGDGGVSSAWDPTNGAGGGGAGGCKCGAGGGGGGGGIGGGNGGSGGGGRSAKLNTGAGGGGSSTSGGTGGNGAAGRVIVYW